MSNKTFSSLLATAPMGLSKEAAGIESPDEVQMEQDFGRMAYMFLKDRAAGMIPYLLGFEIVEREEDGSRAVGIFGFKLGEDYYYVPAFFTNGQVKGMDLLYSKATNTFMPLRESWINSIVNKQTIALGDGVSSNVDNLRRTFEQPRFDFLAVPPNSPVGTVPKVASIMYSREELKALMKKPESELSWSERGMVRGFKGLVDSEDSPKTETPAKSASLLDTIRDGFSLWNHLQANTVDMLDKDAEFQEAWAGAIARLTHQPLPFQKTAEGSDLVRYLRDSGGPRAVNGLMTSLGHNHGFAKAALTFYPDVKSLYVSNFDSKLAPVKVATKVEVVTEKHEYSDGKDKTRLVRDGFTIKDTREDVEKSEVYDVDYTRRFGSPARTGTYNLLLRNGACGKAWIFMPSNTSKNQHCVVVEPSSGCYFLAEPNAIFVRGDEITDDAKPFEKAIDLKDMEVGKTYVILDSNGNATKPFKIRSSMAEDGKRVQLEVSMRDYGVIKRPDYGHDFETLGSRIHYSSTPVGMGSDYINTIELADFEGNKVTTNGSDTLVVPSNWKAIEIDKQNDGGPAAYDESSLKAFKPGSMVDLDLAMSKNAFHKLTVDHDGSEFSIRFDGAFQDGPGVNYKTAMLRLVRDYGLPVDDAEDILKTAQHNMKARKLIKFGQMMVGGQPTSNLVGASMPGEPGYASDVDPFTGATTQGTQVDLMRGQTIGQTPPQNSVQPGFNLGGEAQQDLNAGTLAQQAAQAGQKKVFDHAAIGGLSKVYDSSAVIDSYVPEMMKSLDRVGRILFLFYWKNEEFSNRYGSEDMAEMEDMIRGVFKSFGDLVLKLKQKSVEPESSSEALMS
jgi:hypothetical protein